MDPDLNNKQTQTAMLQNRRDAEVEQEAHSVHRQGQVRTVLALGLHYELHRLAAEPNPEIQCEDHRAVKPRQPFLTLKAGKLYPPCLPACSTIKGISNTATFPIMKLD